MSPRMIVGPVIGKTTHDTARVLFESDSDVNEVVCTARGRDERTKSVSGAVHKGRPVVFKLDGLNPETEYQLEFKGIDCPVPARVRTYATAPTRMNVGAISCNFAIRAEGTRLWEDLRDRFVKPGQLDLLVHLGDQVYGDTAFQEALCLLQTGKESSPRLKHEITDLYRRLYRMTWCHPPTREVLASVPNLMIWDDHDIRDDWGSRPEDRDRESAEHKVGKLARKVYREYQRQLWDDVDLDAEPSSSEVHAHAWGPIGLLMLDQRGARSFHFDPARPYLGTAQWEFVRERLAGGGDFSQVTALLVATSVPLAYLGHWVTVHGAPLMDDLKDHWCFREHQTEQVEMLRALRQWKEARPEREVLVLGGDVHVSGYTDVKYLGRTIFKQLTTSPITNKPPRWIAFQGLRALLEVEQRLGDSYSFEHRDFRNERSYGIVIVRIPKESGVAAHVEGSLTTAG